MSLDTHPTTVVPADTHILTTDGWRPIEHLPPGMSLAHHAGEVSSLSTVRHLGVREMIQLTLADGHTVTAGAESRLLLRPFGDRGQSPTATFADVERRVTNGERIRLPYLPNIHFGYDTDLPLDAYLLGLLLGDGYLRRGTPQWCNEAAEMRPLLEAALPEQVRLTPMIVGAAGTGSSTIVSTAGRRNVVADALRELGVNDKRAWEKFIPDLYLEATPAVRHALLQGLLDTDGYIDDKGRMEFSSSSRLLTLGVRALIEDLGGRASYRVKSGVTYTSPRQMTKKSARDAHRLVNVRLPEGINPFRRPSKAARTRISVQGRQWIVTSSARVAKAAMAVVVDTPDRTWIGEGSSALSAA